MNVALVVISMLLPGSAVGVGIYLMRRYDSRAARGIADAGAMYNELYGMGRAPRFVQVEELPDPPELPEPPGFPAPSNPSGWSGDMGNWPDDLGSWPDDLSGLADPDGPTDPHRQTDPHDRA